MGREEAGLFRAPNDLSGERLKDAQAYRTKKEIYGCERTIVVTHNDNLPDST